MPTQDIIWTVLPNGFRRDGARSHPRVSLFVSPRLILEGPAATASLRLFADFLDWPARVRSRSLALLTGGGQEIPARIVTDPQPDTATWKALFGPDTLVRSHRQDEVSQHFFSYPSGEINRSLSIGYANLLDTSPHAPSSNGALTTAFPELDRAIRRRTTPGAPSIADRLATHAALTAPELQELQREVAGDVLGGDAQRQLSGRLSAASLIARTRSRLQGNRLPIPVVPESSDPASPYAQLAAFHHVPLADKAQAQPEPPDAGDDARFDFHQMLSALAEYPYLMRRLGLVIDLELDPQRLPISEPGRPETLRVKLAQGGNDRAAATHYLFRSDLAGSSLLPFAHFLACPRAWGLDAASAQLPPANKVEILSGLLNCALPQPDDPTRSQFELLQVDIDGAALKLINAIRSIGNAGDAAAQPIDGAMQGGAPAIRTRGIAVIRRANAVDLLSKVPLALDHDAALRAGAAPAFFAEDLVRGYRVDARPFPSDYRVGAAPPPSARWHSLHKRVGTYILPPGPAGGLAFSAIADEGSAQPVLSQAPGGGAADHGAVRVHDSLASWRGWSLSASPPLPTSGGVPQPAAGARPLPGLPEVDITFEPEPQSLPRLRFGQYYQIRMRVADLAGNGLTPAEADDVLSALRSNNRPWPVLFEKAEDFFRYRRFEPIDAPAVVPRADLGPGESEAMLVVRSLGAPKPNDVAGLRLNSDTERHLAPPKASLATAEAHGVLDGAFGAGGNPTAHYAICLRESGSLNDRSIVNLQTARPEPLADAAGNDPATGAQVTVPNGIKFVPVGGPDSREGYSIHYEEQLRLPYLPDPMARGAALFGLPGVGVLEGSGHLVGDRLEWLLPQGELLPEEARKTLGHVTKIGFGPGAGWLDRQPFRLRLRSITAGTAPPRPEWDAVKRILTVCLPPGEQKDVWLTSYPDANSTLVMGVAKWWLVNTLGPTAELPADQRHFINTAPHGALSLISPARKLTLVHAVLRPVHPPLEDPAGSFKVFKLVDANAARDHPTFAYIGGRFTVHSRSTAKIDLLATWTEPGEGAGGAGHRTVSTHVLELPVHIDKQALPAAPGEVATHMQTGDQLTLLAPTLVEAQARRHLARHEFGDTKYRQVTYRLLATSRFREQFPKSVTDDIEAITCHTEIVKDIPSSAPPAAPEISHIIPAQQLLPVGDDVGITGSVRRGGAVRVFLGTSWHSSGDGERLALVGDLEWGADPIHQVGPVQGTIKPEPAPLTVQGRTIYPFDAFYDEQAGLWCSDIVFDNREQYLPFVNLVLARYQPHSLPGMHLSPVVHAGFHQLLPHRAVSLVHSHGGRRIDVTITGPRPAQGSGTAGRIKYVVLASLEERDARRKTWDPDLGWQNAEQQPIAAPQTGGTLWRGHVALTPAGDERERRLVIKEFELFASNDCGDQQWLGARPPELAGFSPRLVYADVIPLA